MVRVIIVLVLVGLGTAPVGCGGPAAPKKEQSASPRRPPKGSYHVRIVRLKLRDRTSPNDQVVRLPTAQMRTILIKLLGELGGYAMDLGGQAQGAKAHALMIDVELQSMVGSEKGKAAVLLSLELKPLVNPDDDPAYVRNALSEKVYLTDQIQSLKTVYVNLLRKAAGAMLRQMAIEIRLRTAPPSLVAHAIRSSRIDELDQGWTGRVDVWQPILTTGLLTAQGDVGLPAVMTALILGWSTPDTGTGDGADVREMSIKAAALRRIKAAVPEIIKVLNRDRRQPVRDLCLGALAEIRDPSAVPALIKYARLGDVQRLRKVLGVVGQIGGKEARAFLEITADGHEDEEIKTLARDTLTRLRPPPSTPKP
jgi:HEAT repeats